ncbi:receiver/sensor box histidine kinase [Halobellus captivus]|uniref:receiver/sensor box histidine kinase n=1 Tax=Halobellus captivus TaxID=2592614 RepID=UPI001396CCA8|nr:ATP-binding protein [Halobellus captivus]
MEPASDRIRVRYVDSDETAAERTATVLERSDDAFEVVASGPPDPVSTFDGTACDCVVSAYDLGSTTGVELLRAIRADDPELPFILYPTAGSERIASDAITAGVTGYVVRETAATDDHETLRERVRAAVADRNAENTEPGSERGETRRLRTFRTAVEASGHSIYYTEPDGTITYVNPAFEAATGYTAEEAIGRTPRILKSGVHDEAFYADLWETILSGDVWRSELTNSTNRGERYVVDQTIAPVEGADGSIEGFVAVNAEVTDQRRRERQLHGLYESMIEWLDADTETELCSLVDRNLSNLPGIDAHAIYRYEEPGDQFVVVTQTSLATPVVAALRAAGSDRPLIREAFERGQSERFDASASDTEIESGLVVPIGSRGVLVVGGARRDAFDASDEAILNVLTTALSEVADRIEKGRELRERNDRLEDFASVVSHDLRNPLSVAGGYLELAQETGSTTHLEEVEHAHERMERIIDDLLWLAHKGRRIGELRRISLANVVARAWEHAETPAATLEAHCTAEIAADPDRLQQLFENLFRNASEHAGPDATVRVGHIGDGPDFYVEDDGPGIPTEERGRVFDSGYTTAVDGTGYGLSIVETVVDAHEWDLRVTESDAGGARFEFRDVDSDALRAGRET